MMGFWTKKDSDNLDSIARSLEKLAEREKDFYSKVATINPSLANRLRSRMKIKVNEPHSLGDEALEESLKNVDRMNLKIEEAKRVGNVPYIVEDLFDEEELESLR